MLRKGIISNITTICKWVNYDIFIDYLSLIENE
jgi:hypothetical protein